jgi:hypothetical protein
MSVTAAMRRIEGADDTDVEPNDREQKYEMYEKTLRALEDIDADDEDEGITVVTNWIIEQIETEGTLPSSKAVRRRAERFCQRNEYAVPASEWIGG